MKLKFTVTAVIPAKPQDVYNGWLNSGIHSGMTGARAKVSDKAGGKFEAWDGYIFGTNLELDPPKRILQKWRTTEFNDSDEDSLLEVLFEEVSGKTKITIHHSDLPENSMQYKKGWQDYYFNPMQAYFKG